MPKKKEPKISAEEKSVNRDYLMARLAAAISELKNATTQAEVAMAVFVDPAMEDDRDEAMDAAHDAAANAVRSFELIDEFDGAYDPTEAEPEPDDEEEGDDDDDDDGEDE